MAAYCSVTKGTLKAFTSNLKSVVVVGLDTVIRVDEMSTEKARELNPGTQRETVWLDVQTSDPAVEGHVYLRATFFEPGSTGKAFAHFLFNKKLPMSDNVNALAVCAIAGDGSPLAAGGDGAGPSAPPAPVTSGPLKVLRQCVANRFSTPASVTDGLLASRDLLNEAADAHADGLAKLDGEVKEAEAVLQVATLKRNKTQSEESDAHAKYTAAAMALDSDVVFSQADVRQLEECKARRVAAVEDLDRATAVAVRVGTQRRAAAVHVELLRTVVEQVEAAAQPRLKYRGQCAAGCGTGMFDGGVLQCTGGHKYCDNCAGNALSVAAEVDITSAEVTVPCRAALGCTCFFSMDSLSAVKRVFFNGPTVRNAILRAGMHGALRAKADAPRTVLALATRQVVLALTKAPCPSEGCDFGFGWVTDEGNCSATACPNCDTAVCGCCYASLGTGNSEHAHLAVQLCPLSFTPGELVFDQTVKECILRLGFSLHALNVLASVSPDTRRQVLAHPDVVERALVLGLDLTTPTLLPSTDRSLLKHHEALYELANVGQFAILPADLQGLMARSDALVNVEHDPAPTHADVNLDNALYFALAGRGLVLDVVCNDGEPLMERLQTLVDALDPDLAFRTTSFDLERSYEAYRHECFTEHMLEYNMPMFRGAGAALLAACRVRKADSMALYVDKCEDLSALVHVIVNECRPLYAAQRLELRQLLQGFTRQGAVYRKVANWLDPELRA